MNVVAILNRNLACPACRGNSGWDPVSRPRRRQNSTISELRCVRCKDRIVVKVPRPNEPASGRYRLIRREFETLTLLETVFRQDQHYGTVSPLGWFDGVMVTRRFDGVEVLQSMRKADAGRVEDIYHGAAAWLRRLHDSNPDGYGTRPVDAGDKLGDLMDRCGHVLHDSRGAAAGWQVLQHHADAVARNPIRSTWSHGDFKPENLLWNGQRLVGLDIHLQFSGPVIFDMASFLDHAWLAGGTFALGRKPRDFEAVERAFLHGYGDLQDDALFALRWAELYFALSYLGRGRKHGVIQASYNNWRIRPLVRMLAERLDGMV